MNLKSFIFYTFLGSSTWVIILAILGYFLGANQAQLAKFYKEISFFFIFIFIVFIGVIIYRNKK